MTSPIYITAITVKIFQQSKKKINASLYPHFLSFNQAIIGNNVYIGPMTCLIEGVHIGENSLIGAGSIVTKDVYSNSTVVGNPGRVIGENKHPEYIQNRWLIKR